MWFLALPSILGCFLLANCSVIHDNFELSVVHFNDFHARFEEVNSKSVTCTNKDLKCFGGFSRIYAEILRLKQRRPDSIVLDAGDDFYGTLWYSALKWKVTQHFLNKIPFDAHTIGNHEFDDKIAGIVPFIKGLRAPTVVANLDDIDEPSLHGLYKKSVVVERNGIKIGIIGVITSTTDKISNTEKLRFLNESESVNKEAIRLVREEAVNTIIVLSHCGYEPDIEIARNAAPKIGLIVGGHSHTLLFTGTPPDNLEAKGQYPTVISHDDGRKILIVQALAYTAFLGNLLVKYNSNGDVLTWSGAPIYLNNEVAEDPEMNEEIAQWKLAVNEYANTVIGKTVVNLDYKFCRVNECNLGNLLTDAMTNATFDTASPSPVIGLMNPGSIRNSILAGDITFGQILEAVPFQSTFDTAQLQGRFIKEALEYSTLPASMSGKGLLQVTGIKVVYNMSKEIGLRVQSVKVKSDNAYEDLDLSRYYRVACNSFLMEGKDGFDMISSNVINRKVGEIDSDVVTRFIKRASPISHGNEGRITIVL